MQWEPPPFTIHTRMAAKPLLLHVDEATGNNNHGHQVRLPSSVHDRRPHKQLISLYVEDVRANTPTTIGAMPLAVNVQVTNRVAA